MTTDETIALTALRDEAESDNGNAGAKASSKAREVRPDVVQAYVRKLEVTLGDDDGFRAEMSRLEADMSLIVKEIAQIAKTFAHSTAKTRAPALKAIWARHQNLMTSRAKSAATAGRIAG